MSVKVGELFSLLRLEDTQFHQAMGRAERRQDVMAGKMMTLGKLAGGLGATMTAGLAVAFATKTYVDFNDKLNQSIAIMGDVSSTMREEMSDAAREVALTTTISASSAAESLFFLASAGLDAEQSISALPVVARFAQAGMFDMATATELLLDAQNALGLRTRDTAQDLINLTRVSDTLTQANIVSNATVQEFAEALTNRAAAAARLLGKDVEETTAVLAVMAAQGIKGEEAGQGLAIVWRDLQKAAINNAEDFKRMGIEVFNSEGTFRNTADVIADLDRVMAGASDEQQRMTLMTLGFQDRSVAYVQALLGTTDAMRRYEGQVRNSAGATEEIAQKQLRSARAQFTLFVHDIQDAVIELGQGLDPAIMKSISVLRLGGSGLRIFAQGVAVLVRVASEAGTAIAVFGGVSLGVMLLPRLFAAGRAAFYAVEGIQSYIVAIRSAGVASATAQLSLGPVAIALGALAAAAVFAFQKLSSGGERAKAMKEAMRELEYQVERSTRQFERQGHALPDAQVGALTREYEKNKRALEEANITLGEAQKEYDRMERTIMRSGSGLMRYQKNLDSAKQGVDVLTKSQHELEQRLQETLKGRSLEEINEVLMELGLSTDNIRQFMPEAADALDALGGVGAEAGQSLKDPVDRLNELWEASDNAAGGLDGLRRSFENLLAPETQQEAALKARISTEELAIATTKANMLAQGATADAVSKATAQHEANKDALEAQLDVIDASKQSTVDLAVAQNSELLPSLDALMGRSSAYQSSLQDTAKWDDIVSDSMAGMTEWATHLRDIGLGPLADKIEQSDIPAMQNLWRTASEGMNLDTTGVGANIVDGIAQGVDANANSLLAQVQQMAAQIISLLNPSNWVFNSSMTETYAAAGKDAGDGMMVSMLDALAAKTGAIRGALREPLEGLRNLVQSVQSEMQRLTGLPSTESAKTDVKLAELRLARARAGPADADTSRTRNLDKQIAKQERLQNIRKLEREVIQAKGVAADATLVTDKDVLATMEKQIDVIREVTSMVQAQSDQLQLKFIPNWKEASDALGGAGGVSADLAADIQANLGPASIVQRAIKNLKPLVDGFGLAFKTAKELGVGALGKEITHTTNPALQGLNDFIRGDVMPTLDELAERKTRINIDFTDVDQLQQKLQEAFDNIDAIAAQDIAFQMPPPRRRSRGGSVQSGLPYIVGEERAELFIPNVNGRIEPNFGAGAGSGQGNVVAKAIAQFTEQLRNMQNSRVQQNFYGTEVVASDDVRREFAELSFHAARMGGG